MNPLSEFRSLFANSKKETSTKRKKYKREESFKLCYKTVCMKLLCSWITFFIHTLFMTLKAKAFKACFAPTEAKY